MEDNSTPAMLRRLIAILIAAIVLALGIAARADSIRLHDETAAAGPRIVLREVAELRGPLAQRLADTVVAEFAESADQARVTLGSVRQVLTDAGVNWGLLSLGGYTSCRVHRRGGPPVVPAVSPASPPIANVEAPITLDTAGSLRGLVVERIAQYADAPVADLRVAFQPRDEALLARPVAPDRYEVEPLSSVAIGRVPLTIRRYRGARVAETFTVIADVARRAMALVATRTIGRGDRFESGSAGGAGNVELREVYLTSDRGVPVADIGLLHGQTAASLLREGNVLYPEDVASPVLVQRGELVTVRCLSGLLVVRTAARAGEDGRLGDQVQVRNESTRESYLGTVTGSREVSVRLDRSPGVLATNNPRGES